MSSLNRLARTQPRRRSQICANRRAESRRLELLDVEGTSKKQKVEAQLAAIAVEISELSEQMKESNVAAATPPRRITQRNLAAIKQAEREEVEREMTAEKVWKENEKEKWGF